jgi:hypothetical protein
MWDVQPGKELWRQEADFYPVTAYSPAGDVVVSGESHDLIRFWEVATGKERRNFRRPMWAP